MEFGYLKVCIQIILGTISRAEFGLVLDSFGVYIGLCRGLRKASFRVI